MIRPDECFIPLINHIVGPTGEATSVGRHIWVGIMAMTGIAPMISVRGLTFTYPRASSPAVKDVSFDVAKGTILGFLGPSGV